MLPNKLDFCYENAEHGMPLALGELRLLFQPPVTSQLPSPSACNKNAASLFLKSNKIQIEGLFTPQSGY
jgi:hypothetical protein